jgi:hypothetical protein
MDAGRNHNVDRPAVRPETADPIRRIVLKGSGNNQTQRVSEPHAGKRAGASTISTPAPPPRHYEQCCRKRRRSTDRAKSPDPFVSSGQ